MSGTVIGAGQSFVISAGISSGGFDVQSGGSLVVAGSDSGSVISSGGSLILSGDYNGPSSFNMFSETNLTVSAGAVVEATSGVWSLPSNTLSGATVIIDSGTFIDIDLVSSNTHEGGFVATSGATFVVDGAIVGVTIQSGGTEVVQSGGTDNPSAFATHIRGAQPAVVYDASPTIIESGGIQILSNGQSEQTIVSGLQIIGAGGVAEAAYIGSGGTQTIGSGGISEDVYWTEISPQAIYAYTPVGVGSGGVQLVGAGGFADGTVVSSGGIEDVKSGGVNSGTNSALLYNGTSNTSILGGVLSGGTLIVAGSDNNTTISGGGTLVLSAGYSETGLIVSAGAVIELTSGVAALPSATLSAVTIELDSGVSIDATTLAGNNFTVASGATLTGVAASGDTITWQAGASINGQLETSSGTASASTSGLVFYDTTTSATLVGIGQTYTGPVAGVSMQYINTTVDGQNISLSTGNWFIHTGAGNDAIAALSGNNVLDGGTGSNFLTGGSGTDTFFVDDRNATAPIWSTVANFHRGDAATIWGISASTGLDWENNQGAAGYTGLTVHAAGSQTASLTLAGYSTADLSNGKLSVSYGTVAGNSYMYIHAN